MIVFQGNRGKVIRLDDPAAQLSIGFVSVTPRITYDSVRSVITRLTISQQANIQFLHTLGAHIYIYVFGDRIGQMNLSGVSFNAPCEYLSANGSTNSKELGIVHMIDWYRTYRIPATGLPVRVSVGSRVIEGFVTGAQYETMEPESGLVQWDISMHTLPDFVIPNPRLNFLLATSTRAALLDSGGGGGEIPSAPEQIPAPAEPEEIDAPHDTDAGDQTDGGVIPFFLSFVDFGPPDIRTIVNDFMHVAGNNPPLPF